MTDSASHDGAVTAPATGAPAEPDGQPRDPDTVVMAMLQEHVPLSLLVDLTAPEGPDSETILAEEGQPEEAWWVQA